MAIKVRCISNWADSYPLHMRLISQFAPDYQNEKLIQFVDDDSYNVLIVFNDKKGFQTDGRPCIGFVQEPPDHGHFYDYNLDSYTHYIVSCADKEGYPFFVDECFSGGMFYHMERPKVDEKSVLVSAVCSGISGGFYDVRQSVVKRAHDLGAEVYARGLRFGRGEIADKADILSKSMFSVCIENGLHKGYVSDKIIDAILCEAVPLYIGDHDRARKIFGDCFVPFNPDDIESVISQCTPAMYQLMLPKLQKAKQKWFEKCNLYEKIVSLSLKFAHE